MNLVTEWVYVIPATEEGTGGPAKQYRQGIPRKTKMNDLHAPELEFSKADDFEVVVVPTLEEAEGGLGFTVPEVLEADNTLLQSKLLPSEIMENYSRAAMKLTREL